MRIDIHHPGVETHKRLIESEIRELSALQQELERLIRQIDRDPDGDSRQLRKSRDSVRDLLMSARRRLEFLTWLSDYFRQIGRSGLPEITTISQKAFDE